MDNLHDSLTAQAGLLGELMTGVTQPVLESLGISLSAFELLSAVRAGSGTLPQAELARRMGVSAPTLCEAVRLATHQGLVVQKAHPTDSRSKLISLTSKGSRIVNEVLRRVNLAESQMVIGIGETELNATIDVLRRVNRNLAKRLREASNLQAEERTRAVAGTEEAGMQEKDLALKEGILV